MPSPDDLRETLRQLADTARDVPDLPLTRSARPRAVSPARPLLLAAGLVVLLLALGLGVGRTTLLPSTPATGPTRAVPAPTSSAPTPSAPTPSAPAPDPVPSSTATPSPDRTAATARAQTTAEVAAQTRRCLASQADPAQYRRGELRVRYARVQAAVGYPRDGEPRSTLLLEDADGYYDCSDGFRLYVGQGGDAVEVDPAAAGSELPTLSGGSTPRCDGPRKAATVETAVVLTTSPRAHAARVTVRAAAGTRSTVLPTRDGFLAVNARVSGEAAWRPSEVTVELLDAGGGPLLVQPYLASATGRLVHPLPPCTRSGR